MSIMVITPSTVQAFQITQSTAPGTYPLINGVVGQKIRLLSYNITSTAGTVVIQDTSGVVITTLNGESGIGFSGIYELTVGAGLEAIISNGTTNINAYFVGFLQ